ncbi:S8 family serine peptidase [Hyalangium sp.]|uniref:S8 family serine peptidase n=1 Tax=Hyalangium sp. TaxID=2028555 RepID=UPI002D5D711D|nr:S8 family serine peptidase [Hyalangium sp.]HYH98465.1 S8 family serine peptidase [Hyalangium sp.]
MTNPLDCTTTTEEGMPAERLSALSEEPEAQDGRQSFLIRYRRTVSSLAARAAEDSVKRAGGQVTASWAGLGAVAARLTPEQRAVLAQDPDVLTLERDRTVRAFERQALATSGSVGEYTEGLKLVQAPLVWDANNDGVLDATAPNGTGIKVCVVDSGWDNRHPELQAAYVAGKDFVDDDDEPLDFETNTGKWGGGHGTHTAATVVAQLGSHGTVNPGEEPNGVVGVAPGVGLLVARVLNTRGNGSTADIISAIEWCQQQGAKVISLSLGAPEPSATEEAAFKAAVLAGLLPIAATGNSGTGDPATEPGVAYPAAYDGVLAVGAVNFKSEHPAFSQVGPQVALVAPGVDVLSAMIVGAESFSQVEVDGRTFESRSLAFAPLGEYTGKLLTCGIGNSKSACGDEATCDGFVAYVDRGGLDGEGNGLTFAKKVTFMRRAGAKAVLVGNNDPGDGIGNFTLGTEDTWLPTASVSHADGSALKGLKGKAAKVKLVGVDYSRLTGTSMATPHVSGVAALLWSARPTLTALQVRALLQDSAQDLGTSGRDNAFGFGLVQAKAALDLLQTRHP